MFIKWLGKRNNLSILLLIFFAAVLVRIYFLFPNNVIIGFDQARDLFAAKTIFTDFDIKIIGPTAGNNLNLHHGVLWIYFILPAIIIFGGDPFWVAVWNCLFNALSIIILFLFAKSLFGKKAGIIAAFLTSLSFYFVSYSGWLSNPAPTLVTVPLFFYGIWKYYEGKNSGFILSLFVLGVSIQFELFFLYLIPIFIFLWLILRPKFPDIKTLILGIVSFGFATSTMILTEIKYNFSGVLSILGAGEKVQKYSDYSYISAFINRFFETFAQTIIPIKIGFIFGIFVLGFLVFQIIKSKKEKTKLIFLLIYLLSPAIMLILGYHAAPWFLIGLPPAIILVTSFAFSKINNNYLLILILTILGFVNLSKINISKNDPFLNLLEPDRAAIMQKQIDVIDYTYTSSNGEKFAVNTLTNPLYINVVWGWQYEWYGKNKSGYLPSFAGGGQLYPYNTLPDFDEDSKTHDEKYLYLIFDTTPRIPEVHSIVMREWADKISKFVESRDFGGVIVEKRVIFDM